MKLSILAVTAASVVALSTTFAAAQTDMNRGQRGEHPGRPQASMAQPQRAQPSQRPAPGGTPMQAQGYTPQAQPGPAPAQPPTTEQPMRAPSVQAAPNHQWANGPEDRGQAAQAQPGNTGEGQHGAASQPQTAPPRNQPQHTETAMPNGRQPTATDHSGGREQHGTMSQTQTIPPRDLPRHAQTPPPNGRQPTASEHLSGREHVGVSVGARIGPQYRQATAQFASTRERTPGTDRFGAHSRAQVAVGVTPAQSTELRQRLAMVSLHRTGHFGFTAAIGIAVPRTVALYPLPPAAAEVVPQFRGYSYVADQEEIVIVAPQTYQVAAVIPMGEVYYGSSAPHSVSGCP